MRWGILLNLAVILAVSGVLLFLVFGASLERAAIDTKAREAEVIVDVIQSQIFNSDSPEKMWEGVRSICKARVGLWLAIYNSHGEMIGGCGLKRAGDRPINPEPGRRLAVEGFGWPNSLFHGIFVSVDSVGPFKHGVKSFRISLEIPPSVFAPAWKFFGAYLILTQSALFFLGYVLFHRTVIGPIRDLARLAGKAAGITDATFPEAITFKGDIQHIASSLRGLIAKGVEDREKMEALIEKLKQINRELEHAQQGLIRSEKLAGVGRLAAGMAHEIGNPLQILMGYVELLQRKAETKPHEEVLNRMDQELKRIHNILQRLLEFARPIRKNIELCDINALVRDCGALIEGRKGFRNLQFEYLLDPNLPQLKTEPEKIRQIFINLLFNAADAIPETGGKISLQTRNFQNGVEIEIRDTGCGIPEADLGKVFDPFFTTKDPGKGTGLGLAVCLGLVESLNGKINIRSKPGEGTVVTVTLPPYQNSNPGCVCDSSQK